MDVRPFKLLNESERGWLARNVHAIDGEGRACERRAAERKTVDAPAAIAHSLGVAREHRLVGE